MQVDIAMPLEEVVRGMDDSDRWEDAELKSCIQYVAKSQKLRVPDSFAHVYKEFMDKL